MSAAILLSTLINIGNKEFIINPSYKETVLGQVAWLEMLKGPPVAAQLC